MKILKKCRLYPWIRDILMRYIFLFLQLIQTISAVDKDDPLGGQKFFFSLAAVNPNFTVQDNEGKFQNLFIMTYDDINRKCP